MWLKELKIALIQKDVKGLNSLMDAPPHLEKQTDIDAAITLIAEAKAMVEALKKETEDSMKQVKKNIDFLKATEAPVTNKLDIKS